MSYKKFIFVKGDVSGIQDFIFNVKSEHAAKELKGRSFFIKLLIEVAIKYLLDKMELVDPVEIQRSKISTSGGNFILKLPDIGKSTDIVCQAQRDFTRALRFTGLNISIAHIIDSGIYKNNLKNLDAACRNLKYKFYHETHDYFEPFEKKHVAHLSTKWELFTTQIKSNRCFIIQKIDDIGETLTFENNFIKLAGYKIIPSNVEEGVQLSNHLESIFPQKTNHEIKDFNDLSKSDFIDFKLCEVINVNGGEKGLNKLGVLAMDVDGLGNIMTNIETEQQHTDLDNKLRQFFNNTIKEIINDTNTCYQVRCNNGSIIKIPRYKNKIYSVTAGGDDSFFVGKWNTILDFAFEVRKVFKMNFPDLTISAGIIIIDPKFPVVRFAELVEQSLKKAKYGYKTKGNICLFGEVIKWEILSEVRIMRNLLKKPGITGGMLSKARLASNKLKDASVLRLEDFWKMGYYLRDLDINTKKTISDKTKNYMSKSILEDDELKKKNYLSILPVAARLAELDKR